MAWLPKYKVDGGLYAGYLCPPSPINGLVNICQYKEILYNVGRSWGDRYDSDSDYVAWAGSTFSMSGGPLIEYIKQHADDTDHEFLLAELIVANPEGAQFYKQSLTIYAKVLANEQIFPDSSESHDDCTAIYYELSFVKICRREYPTPYSAWTETELGGYGPGHNGYIYKSGGKQVPGWLIHWTDNIKVAMGNFTVDNTDCFGMVFYKTMSRADDYNHGWGGLVFGVKLETLNEVFIDFDPEEQEDPNEDDDEGDDPGPGHGGSGGGNGGHELPDYPITIPPKPTIGPCSVSWLTTYMMSAQDLDDFGQDLVNPDAIQKLKQFFNDPLDAIVGITMCPAVAGPRYSKTPTIHGTVPYEWSRSFMAILNQYVDIDCGIVRIDPFWDSCFDFDPYTRFSLFLPFIGYRDINADEIMGTNVHIVYRIDVVTGDCTAFVTKAAPSESMYGPMPDQIIGQFNGNCGVSVPIGRVNKDAAMQASFSLLAGAIGMGVGGAAAAAGLVDSSDLSEGQLASQVTHSTMTAVNAMKTKIERSGAISGNTGYLGYLRPYFIRKLARQSRPDNYKEIMGYPCNKPGPLRNYRGTGLAVVEDIQLNNIPAFGDELAEIISLLKGGVII